MVHDIQAKVIRELYSLGTMKSLGSNKQTEQVNIDQVFSKSSVNQSVGFKTTKNEVRFPNNCIRR